MNKYIKTLSFILLIVILFMSYLNFRNSGVKQQGLSYQDGKSIIGCYVFRLSKDIYVLNIDQEDANGVTGKLTFNNYEKDSSAGTFNGSYKDGILSGYYTFTSEGLNSVAQMIFKKTDQGFIRGIGEMRAEGDSAVFEDVNTVTFDPSQTFFKDDDCNSD